MDDIVLCARYLPRLFSPYALCLLLNYFAKPRFGRSSFVRVLMKVGKKWVMSGGASRADLHEIIPHQYEYLKLEVSRSTIKPDYERLWRVDIVAFFVRQNLSRSVLPPPPRR